MQISVIIPVWNGAEVIRQCLQTLFDNTPKDLREVICVENASADESRSIIGDGFPAVKLIPLPVNLGFAGGVNTGLRIAQGDILVLLNQDLMIAPGWTDATQSVFRQHKDCGIVGAVIRNADDTINHAGAAIEQPLGHARHQTTIPEASSWSADYVTGALFAIRQDAWRQIGEFDEDFYPAYYEESDYCYRARAHSFDVRVARAMAGTHLFSSREWQRDPIRHSANQHRSRYRFIGKHFSPQELTQFLDGERDAAGSEESFDQAVGRTLAAGYILKHFDSFCTARNADCSARNAAENSAFSPLEQRQLQVGFTAIRKVAFERAAQLSLPGANDEERGAFTFEKWQAEVMAAHQTLAAAHDWRGRQEESQQQLVELFSTVHGGITSETATWKQQIQTNWEFISGQGRDEILQLLKQVMELADIDKRRADLLESVFAHRLNLLERQAGLLEYRQRLTDVLAKYEYF